ncbi:MAG: right-handed parallel beta-helix repeat-containing protein [Thermoplasmatales archaeon]|nr:right-handed parallel beta-helix repeat-containing protein [Thermoplasmatales archaeon]
MKKNIVLKDAGVLLIVVVMVLSTVIVTVNADCPDGMISYWKGDGNAKDSYGSNDGTYSGLGYENGKVDQTFSFDGFNDHVRIPHHSSLNLGTGDFTLEAWIKPNYNQKMHSTILSNRGDDEENGFLLGILVLQGYAEGSLFLQIDGTNYIPCNIDLRDYEWHHVAVTRTGISLAFYVDGVEDGTANSGKNMNSDGDMIIGWDEPVPDVTPYKGLIDEMAIYNKALSIDEIEFHYFAGLAEHGYCECPDPVYVDDDYSWEGYNDGHDWGYDAFDNICDGIDAACDGTVCVAEGIYYENVVIDKPINIIGENKDTTIIDGGGISNVVNITADYVNFLGCTVRNSGSSNPKTHEAGIYIGSSHNNIYNNIISDNYAGMRLCDPLYSDNCKYNNIFDNTITLNDWGIELDRFCTDCEIFNNLVTWNNKIGIEIWSISNPLGHNHKILDNIISNNGYGILLSMSNSCTISGNNICSNYDYGIYTLNHAGDNIIYNNYFDNINNAHEHQMVPYTRNIWNITKTPASPENIIGGDWLGGNYWSDYSGFDYTGDFLGDTDRPYDSSGFIIHGGDMLPLTDLYKPGHTLITEFDPGRVIEVDGSGSIIWQKTGLVWPMDAERLTDGNTLIAEVGQNRVIEVNKNGVIGWNKTGISNPYDVERLANENTLITLWGYAKVIEVNSNGDIIRQWGSNRPYDAEMLDLNAGIILLTEFLNDRVIEINPSGTISWQKTGLVYPVDAERLADGNTLIAEYGKNRIIEVNQNGEIEWEMKNIGQAMDAERLAGGNTLIVHRQSSRVIEVNHDCEIVWQKTGLSVPMDAERLPVIPPNTPNTPSGTTSGKPGVSYDFSTSATHPNGNQLYYQWKWGDGNKSGWLGPYESGETVTASYAWAEKGDYEIKVKAKDSEDIDSEWSDPLTVTLTRNRAIQTPLLNFLENHPILYQLLQRFLRL